MRPATGSGNSFNHRVDNQSRRIIINRMVEYGSGSLDRVFHALSDPTRRAILQRLASRPRTVGELSEPFDISLNAVSKHLKALERAGLISREVRGREHHCMLNPAALASAYDWLAFYERFWNERLDLLADLVEERRKNSKERK